MPTIFITFSASFRCHCCLFLHQHTITFYTLINETESWHEQSIFFTSIRNILHQKQVYQTYFYWEFHGFAVLFLQSTTVFHCFCWILKFLKIFDRKMFKDVSFVLWNSREFIQKLSRRYKSAFCWKENFFLGKWFVTSWTENVQRSSMRSFLFLLLGWIFSVV